MRYSMVLRYGWYEGFDFIGIEKEQHTLRSNGEKVSSPLMEFMG